MTHPENWTRKTKITRDAEVVRRLLASDERAKALEIAAARGRRVWIADDGNAEIECDSPTREDAAREYVDGGSYGDANRTDWVDVYTWPRYVVGDLTVDDLDERTSDKITIEPEEPACADGHDHEWRSPYDVLGGCRENPGVWGHGGGVIIREVCRHCGCLRTTDTWAQDRSDNTQGLTSVEYEQLGDHEYSEAYAEWAADEE